MTRNSKTSSSKEDNSSLSNIVNSAKEIPLHEIAPKETAKRLIPEEQVLEVIVTLAGTFGISTSVATIGVYLLVLKGAANLNSPSTLSVEVLYQNEKVTIQKHDLLYCYSKVTGNKYLRRLAEALAIAISGYAEINNLSGDLANKINTRLLAEGEPVLTSKEKAWASSFCQNVPNLEQYAGDRLPQLLAKDYAARYDRDKKGKKVAQSTSAPAADKKQAAPKETAKKQKKAK